jgi:hypothetical protein
MIDQAVRRDIEIVSILPELPPDKIIRVEAWHERHADRTAQDRRRETWARNVEGQRMMRRLLGLLA